MCVYIYIENVYNSDMCVFVCVYIYVYFGEMYWKLQLGAQITKATQQKLLNR